MIRKCLYCKKEFKTSLCNLKRGQGKYCSNKCKGLNHRKNKSYLWKGGIIKDKSGYILCYSPDHPYNKHRYVRKHRLIMEDYLGRYLKKNEYIHHKNGIKNDNRLNNLELLTLSEHRSWHAKNYIRDIRGKFSKRLKVKIL